MNRSPESQQVRWQVLADAAAIASAVALRIAEAARSAIAARGSFLISLAGGDTPRPAYRLLREMRCDWPRWHVYYGDERCAPADDPLRNSRMAAVEWLDHVAIPGTQIHAIPAELGANAGARAYAQCLHGIGAFDLVLLGLGEDGHTASLFPGHDWGAGGDAPAALAVFDAPKPPSERVSLSAARLSRARAVLCWVTGRSKRDAVAAWRSGAAIPARAITPDAGVDVLVESALLAQNPSQKCLH